MVDCCTTDITSPHSALKNIELMHDYLQNRLKSIQDSSDLIPYIRVLMPLNNLKIQLSALLHQQYKAQKQSQNDNKPCIKRKDKIRSLYIRLCGLNGIPNDVLHAKIISFLPSTEYKKLPMLCTHFRNIMRSFPFIYNHKKYSVQLLLKNRAFSVSSNTIISVMHNTKNIIIKPLTNNYKNKYTKNKDKICDYSNVLFPFHDIHIYKMYCESVCDWLYVGSEYKNQSDDEQYTSSCTNFFDEHAASATDINQATDSYNISSIQLLSQSHAAIKYLCVENMPLTLQKMIFNTSHKFNQCLALNIRASPTYDAILNHVTDATFCKLQYLEIWYPKQDKLHENKLLCAELMRRDPAKLCTILDDRQLDQFYAHIARKKVLCDAMNKILERCVATLTAFVYHDEKLNWGWTALMLEHLKNSITYKGVLSIPNNIEFLSLRNSSFCIDLSHCVKLIAIEVLGDTHYTEIKWRKGYMIPYAYLSPPKHKSFNDWKHKLLENDECQCRFICLGKKIQQSIPTLKFAWDPELNDLNEIVDNDESDQLERYKINEVRIRETQHMHLPHMCLLLDITEMNRDLFNKIMCYKFDNEQVKMNKMEIYQSWWNLGAGNWIKNIGVITKWNGRSKKKPSYWSTDM